MKKIIFAVLSAAVILISCAKKQNEAVVFSVGGAPNEISVWEEVASGFTSETGIKVKIIRQPTDSGIRRQGLVVPLKSRKSTPDIFTMDVAWIGQFAASGWLEKIDADTGPFFEKVIDTADIYNSGLIALPVNIDAGILYYRKDIIKSPPETWPELKDMSRKFMRKNPGKYGYVWQGAQYEGLVCNFLETAVSAGGGIKIGKGGAVLNTPENIKALKFMAGMVRTGISPENTYTEMKEEEVRNMFQRGDALFERNWPYAWALHESDGSPVKGKTAIAPLPHFKGNRSAAALGGWHAGISAYSKNKEKALKFLNYITSYKTQKKFALELGWNPGRVDVYNDGEVLEKLPHFKALKKVFINATARPGVPYYTQASDVLQKELNAAIAGKKTAEEALSSAEKEINAVIRKYEN